LLVVVLIKEVIPYLLDKRDFERLLEADQQARHRLFTGRPLNLPLNPGAPLAFYEVH